MKQGTFFQTIWGLYNITRGYAWAAADASGLPCGFIIEDSRSLWASVSLWWFAQNFFDIAPYINDARSGTLPLLGGNIGHSSPYGFHDWQFILTESHLLKYDHFLARVSVIIGAVLLSVSFLWAGILVHRQYKNITENKKEPLRSFKTNH